jgi:cysteine desulfurase / selenocysteine lyase
MITLTGQQADAVLTRLESWQAGLHAQFPIFERHPGLAYLDSAATTQKPQAVLEAVQDYLTTANANAGRGSYTWANVTTELVEHGRSRIKEFLADPHPSASTVEFTSGTSEGLRAVAEWLTGWLRDGDEIIVPFGDHNANHVPWLEAEDRLAERGTKITVHPLPVDPASGDYDHRALPERVNERTRFVAATHVHHVYGADLNVHRIREVVGPDVPICLDAAQSVGHLPTSVAELDVDFVAFSGHKTMALPGIGAVWARNRRGPAFALGGWAGSPNTVGVLSLTTALDWLTRAGLADIRSWNSALAVRLAVGLHRLPDIEILGCQQSLAADSTVQRREGTVAFRHTRIPSGDLGFALAGEGFMVRADSHCQAGRDPLDDGSVRVSAHVYNTPHEIDRLLAALASY